MSNEKMREEFEEAFHQARCQLICTNEDRSVAWAFFAASREALVIDLPILENFKSDESAHGMLVMCRHQIKAAGLKVKS